MAKLTKKVLKGYNKKELLKLTSDYDFGFNDTEKKGLKKLKKSELMDKMMKAPYWKCVAKVLPVKQKRERTTKQKEAFEKMRKSLAEQLLEVKYQQGTPVPGSKGPQTELQQKKQKEVLKKIATTLRPTTGQKQVGTEAVMSSPNMSERTTVPDATLSSGINESSHMEVSAQPELSISGITSLNIPSGVSGKVIQERQLEIENLLNEYRQTSTVLNPNVNQFNLEKAEGDLGSGYTRKMKIVYTVRQLEGNTRANLINFAKKHNLLDLQRMDESNYSMADLPNIILDNTKWLTPEEKEKVPYIRRLLNDKQFLLQEVVNNKDKLLESGNDIDTIPERNFKNLIPYLI